jgi:glycosyltransferase involved in cell wall biosynthesis
MSVGVPSVSVVVTCFNYERYVGLCVRSILRQTLQPLEVIVVNAGSTDGSAAVLAGFGDRIRVIEQPNSGLVPARNRGFAASRGELVLFIDADDMLHPQALEEVVRAWRPGCVKVQFELELIDSEGVQLDRRMCNYVEPYGSPEVRKEFSEFGLYVWPTSSGNVYSRSYLQRLFPLTVTWGPDGVLNTVAPLYGEVQVVNRVLGYLRLHGANNSFHGLTAGPIGRRFAKRIAIRSDEFRILAEHAASLGHVLPRRNVGDYDLTFVTYRMMLKRLGEDYEGAAADTPGRLWKAGVMALIRRPLPASLKLAHAAWLTTMLFSPRWLCRLLVLLRFNRADLLQPIRRTLAAIRVRARREA